MTSPQGTLADRVAADRGRAESLLTNARTKFLAGVWAVLLALVPLVAEKAYDELTGRETVDNAGQCFAEVMRAERLRQESPEIAALYRPEGKAEGLPKLTDEAVRRACDGGAEDVLEELP